MLVCSLTLIAKPEIMFTRETLFSFLYYNFLFIFVFAHNVILLDKLLLKGRTLLYCLSLIPAFLIFIYVKKIILSVYPEFYIRYPLEGYYFILSLSLGVAIFFTTRYLFERSRLYEINILKREVELQQLKFQLNPHFLFNSLNNIYSYNLENNTYGNDLILKLSQLMRFIVESSPKETIQVSEEVSFIDNYLSFENERLGYRCDIRYSKTLQFPHRQIPPLVFFPFIENAFKHGTNTNEKTKIEIEIYDSSTDLALYIKNDIGKNGVKSTKTGLSNAKRRLELLFPEKHSLEIRVDADTYIVNLSLTLD